MITPNYFPASKAFIESTGDSNEGQTHTFKAFNHTFAPHTGPLILRFLMEMERNTVKCDLCRDLPAVCGQTADQSEQPLALNVDDQSVDQMKHL